MEAARNRARHASGSAVGSILQPVNGVRDAMRRRGQKPKDHARANIAKMRAQQRKHREDREAAAEAKEGFKLRRFAKVQSRVDRSGVAKDEASGASPPKPKKKFLRRKSDKGPAPHRMPSKFVREGPRKASVPKAREVARLAPRSSVDFVSSNAVEVITAEPKRRASEREETKHGEFGKVPAYLQKRRAKWAATEADRIASAPDPDCPPGMTVMPESERLETLRALKATLDDVKANLQRLPLTIETPSQIRRKNALEAKYKEVEDAVKIFSRRKVFVRDD